MMFHEACGWWFPDGEQHLPDWMRKADKRVGGRLTYQRHKYEAVLSHVRQRRIAVDVGAHVGLWSWMMARDFASVWAFEPMPAHRDCWQANLRGVTHAHMVAQALGPSEAEVTLRTRTPDSSGDTGVEPAGGEGVRVQQRRLDDYPFLHLDLLKIDCEGYELFVLQGAVDTLRLHRPAIIVEQKPETGMAARYGIGNIDAVLFLQDLGAKVRQVIAGDYIMSWS